MGGSQLQVCHALTRSLLALLGGALQPGQPRNTRPPSVLCLSASHPGRSEVLQRWDQAGERISWRKPRASWVWLSKWALCQFPLMVSPSSMLGPWASSSFMSSPGVGRRRGRLLACPVHTDFLSFPLQLQLQRVATAWIYPEPQEGTDGQSHRVTGSCFLRGSCCFRYCAVAWLFGISSSCSGACGPICGARGDSALPRAALL